MTKTETAAAIGRAFAYAMPTYSEKSPRIGDAMDRAFRRAARDLAEHETTAPRYTVRRAGYHGTMIRAFRAAYTEIRGRRTARSGS